MILPEATQAKSSTQGSIAELGVASMSIDAPIPQAGPRRASVTLSRITPSYSGQALGLRGNPGQLSPSLSKIEVVSLRAPVPVVQFEFAGQS